MMRSAASVPAEEPVPDRAGLEAKAAQACGELQAAAAEIRDALRYLSVATCDPRLAAKLEERLRLAAAGAFDAGIHAEEMRGALADYAVACTGEDHLLAVLGDVRERQQEAPAKADARHGHRRARSGWQRAALTAVKVLIPAAAAGTWAALKGTARAHRLATVALTATLPAAALGGALYTSTPSSPGGSYGSGTGPAPAASVEAAVPLPSSSLIAVNVTHPKAKNGAKGKTLLSSAGVLLPCCYAAPESSASSSSAQSSPSSSGLAVRPQITVSTSAIDLSGSTTSEVITVDATGGTAGSWSAWRVILPQDPTTGEAQADLDFSAMSGVLLSGQSASVTVSLDPVQDGLSSEVFSIDGQSVTADLPLPVPVVSVSPTVTVSIPPVVPSDTPSPASS